MGLLPPGCSAAHDDVGCAGAKGAVVVLVAVDAHGVAVLIRRPDYHRIARHGHRIAEEVTVPSVRGFEIGLLAPRRAVAHEHIGCTRIIEAIVALVTIYAGGATGLPNRPNDDGVASYRHRSSKVVIGAAVVAFELGLLGLVCAVE